MEYIEHGDLDSLITKDYMVERDARVIAAQVLEGLNVMHKHEFCHRDLKPQVGNIL